MRIITEPEVFVISQPIFHGFVPECSLPPDGNDFTRLGAFAAKTCYRSFGETGRLNADNQRVIIKSKHGRILEHLTVGVYIRGISRALGNELITHKPGFVVSQESTRYVGMEDAAIVLEPYLADIYRKYQSNEEGAQDDLISSFVASCDNALHDYGQYVKDLMELAPEHLSGTDKRKWARGKARNVLPLALETRMVVTANLRAWRHFIEIRSECHAEAEIRRLSNHLFNALRTIAPLYFEDYTSVLVDGFYEYQTELRKV